MSDFVRNFVNKVKTIATIIETIIESNFQIFKNSNF